MIQSFEFTFELAWKTLKDYLENMGLPLRFPREVIKTAFQNDLIKDGTLWLDMLEKRNELTNTYDEAHVAMAIKVTREEYFGAIQQVYNVLCTLK